MKKAMIFGGVILLFVIIHGCRPGIPTEVNKVIFEKSEFSKPVTLKMPCEDNPERIDKVKKI